MLPLLVQTCIFPLLVQTGIFPLLVQTYMFPLLVQTSSCPLLLQPFHLILGLSSTANDFCSGAGSWCWHGWQWCRTMLCWAAMARLCRQRIPPACCNPWTWSPPPPSLLALSPTCKPAGRLPSEPLLPSCPKPLVGPLYCQLWSCLPTVKGLWVACFVSTCLLAQEQSSTRSQVLPHIDIYAG